ncbi:MAG: TetR/AcrR family transcriptional regulator [Sneathiella sp.]|nr:TetR/AcrR family transcriptional regulator [Sneathiella sp.]
MKKMKSERTREEILDKAWDLVAQGGANVSMADIAKAVGITRQSIYIHFKSRGGLLDALVKRADERENIIENLEQAIETVSASERLDKCLTVWFEFVPIIHPVATDLIALRKHDPDAAFAWNDRMKDLHGIFHRLTESLARDEKLSPLWSASDAADYLWVSVSMQSWDLFVGDRGWSPMRASKTLKKSMAQLLLIP